MKKTLLRVAYMATMAVAIVVTANVFVACSDDDTTASADKTELNALITECETLAGEATTSKYPQGAIDAFNTVLEAAKTIAAKTDATQTEVDNVTVQLTEASEIFLAAAYGAIPASALLIGLTFDEESTTTLTAEGKGLVATLAAGPVEIFGNVTNKPSFVTGKKGKAIYFNNGSHLEIATYAAADFRGKTLSIAVWVNPDSTRAGNYIFSYNYWNSWKFQLQDQNKPFFTVHTVEDGWTDADNEMDQSAPNKTWTHLVATLNLNSPASLSFYVNGQLTKTWDETTKPGLAGASGVFDYANSLPLLIGASTTYAEANTWDWEWAKTPAAWDSFVGAIDELKVYNITLTEGQVSGLYDNEK
jgi:hypothetical protein